ncbi:MAG: hypothetical protein ACLVJN_07590 [Streptococcus parasanguinis]
MALVLCYTSAWDYLGNHFPIPATVMASDANKGGLCPYPEATKAIFGPDVARIFLAGMVTVTCFHHNRRFDRLYQGILP